VFLAVELPSAGRRQLASLLGQLAGLDKQVRPTRAEGLHLTLRFLGQVEPGKEAWIRTVAARVARETVAFPFELGGLEVFAEAKQPRVIWAGIREGQAELGRLAEALAAGLFEAGWPPELRPIRAHCTLARVPEPLGASSRAALAALCDRSQGNPPLLMRAEALALLESIAMPVGPNRYPCRASWPLQQT